MFSTSFSLLFLGTALLTIVLFAVGEALPQRRNQLATLGALAEAAVFALLTIVFYHIQWGQIPSWLMGLLPAGGTALSLRMAYKRYFNLPL